MSKVHNDYHLGKTPLDQTEIIEDENKPVDSNRANHEPKSGSGNEDANSDLEIKETKSNKCGYSYSLKTFFITVLIFVLLAVIGGGCAYILMENKDLKNDIEELKATTDILLKQISSNPKSVSNTAVTQGTTTSKPLSWVYFDTPKAILPFRYDNLRQNLMKFDQIIPRGIKVKHVKFILVMAHCGVAVNNDYWARLKVIHSKGQDYHFTWGIGTPFGNCLWNSELVTLNIEESREIRVQSNLVLDKIELRFNFVGYSVEVV